MNKMPWKYAVIEKNITFKTPPPSTAKRVHWNMDERERAESVRPLLLSSALRVYLLRCLLLSHFILQLFRFFFSIFVTSLSFVTFPLSSHFLLPFYHSLYVTCSRNKMLTRSPYLWTHYCCVLYISICFKPTHHFDSTAFDRIFLFRICRYCFVPFHFFFFFFFLLCLPLFIARMHTQTHAHTFGFR